jgi:hypothetical protein
MSIPETTPKNIIKDLDARSEIFELENVKGDVETLKRYINSLNKLCPAPLETITNKAKEICIGLPEFWEKNMTNFENRNNKANDKGLTGKYCEAALFANMPNSTAKSDLSNGYDVKATHFKKLRDAKTNNGGYNAKDRLTITNCGTSNDYDSFKDILDNEDVTNCRYYEKIQRGIVFVFQKDVTKEQSINNIQNKTLLFAFLYDLSLLSPEYFNIIKNDYALIRKCIEDKAVSQKGQQYLHIHKHGNKGSGTRAIGFTPQFLTKLASEFADKKLITNGRSVCVEISSTQ